SLDTALELVDAAAEAGADAVKFQTFAAELVISKYAPKADYQKKTTDSSESQLDMVRRLELNREEHLELQTRCIERGIQFLSSPFDEPSVDFLYRTLGLEALKIPSGEITNAPLLLRAARTGCSIYMSTGMSTLGEIEDALGVLAFGYLSEESPSLEAFRVAFFSEKGQSILKRNVTLLHCTTEYPAPFDEVNLNTMETLRRAFDLTVGYSDHTEGIVVPIAAVALGAQVIEKHFTLDRTLPGPDHKASLEPDDLARMIRSIREVEAALGNGKKIPTYSELKNRNIARKSLVAAEDIPKGSILTKENMTAKRPGDGISPFRFWDCLGSVATADFSKDNKLDLKRM
ncbi:MAG: N-acetylneuraminate synthase, partial [Synergistales bacterium]|nr:N-acetylneuraminate synthase [Synergistales bacterium]